jgi:hypothetical protein
MREVRNAYEVFVGKPEGKAPLVGNKFSKRIILKLLRNIIWRCILDLCDSGNRYEFF